MEIDTSTEFGARAARRLEREKVVWLTTVGPNLTPQPSPVWFFWDGETALLFSQPRAPKVRNINRTRRVSLSFNSTPTGGDVVIMTGDAWIDAEAPAMDTAEPYMAKYTDDLPGLGMTWDEIARQYSTAIRVRPTTLRGE